MAALKKCRAIEDDFSIAGGGPFYESLQKVVVFRNSSSYGLIVFWTALTWAPLFALCMEKGTAWGSQVEIPLLLDPSIFSRFFVALPLLISAQFVIDRFIRQTVSIFSSSGIITREDLPVFRTALQKIARLRDSATAELVLAMLALIPFYLVFAEYEWIAKGASSWHGTTSQGLSPAGWWFTCVSTPILRFFMFRWLWRYGLWIYLLSRVRRLHLMLLPTHPDRLGGLGFLLYSQQQFGIVAMALSSVVAGQFANEIVHFGETFNGIRAPAAVFVAGSLIVILSPLLFFSSNLISTRYEGLLRHNEIARKVASRFDLKWVRGEVAPEAMIGTQDPSSMIDYISTYDVIRETLIIPISKRAVVQVATLAAAPFASLWLLNKPFERLITEILKRLLD